MLNVTVNRSLDGKFKKLEQMVEGYRDIYLGLLAAEIIDRSPADSGAFLDGLSLGYPAESTSSSEAGRSRRPSGEPAIGGPTWQRFSQVASDRMTGQIKSLAEGLNSVSFYSGAEHTNEVEYTHGYAPFSSAAREHNRIAKEAEAQAKARFL